MSLDKIYKPQQYEDQIYKKWEESQAFKPVKTEESKPFVVTLPPPNANANLHIGHALDFQLKDIIGRHRRLLGDEVLLLPGADHAGFETWAVYEKHLNEQGKSRFDFSRQELYDQVYEFVDKNRSKMENQIRKLGISCDWEQFTFTLDNKIVKASYQAFNKMWDQGLIYRAKRLVNYCTQHQTAFADIEVVHQEIKGYLYSIDYPLKDGSGAIRVATTRPETMLGDVAVAVHPQDKRYKDLIGKDVILPITNRTIPIIADEEVKMDFGTGAVKITPGSDFMDFEIGNRHKLPVLEILNTDGKFNDNVGKDYQGLDIKTAREKIIKELEDLNLLKDKQPYNHQVGCCYKCNTILEPLLRDQWFVKMTPLAQAAIKKIEAGEIKFYPPKKAQELITYLKTVQDWNISRQIAWGIPIPVFENINKAGDWIYNEQVDQATITVGSQAYKRDLDVFDTWWSSGQWAYASFNYQDNPDYYPTSLMETGIDILRPWVSRMIVLSLYITQQVPFKEVYLHGMVVDEHGAKMSKSKGNVVNPMDIINQYGADALRLGLISGITPAQAQAFGLNKIQAGRNFCNKLWNIGRFIQSIASDNLNNLKDQDQALTQADHYILDRFYKTKAQVDKHLKTYKLNLAWEAVYSYIWHDLADWYLEASKIKPNPALLSYIFENSLRLVHPWTPFVSEVLYQELYDENKFLINNKWSNQDKLEIDTQKVHQFEIIQSIIIQIRQLLDVKIRDQAQLHVEENANLLDKDSQDLILSMTNILKINIGQPALNSLKLTQALIPAWIKIESSLLKDKYLQLERNLKRHKNMQSTLESRLKNKSYLQNAPKSLIKQSEIQLEETIKIIKSLNTEIAQLKQINA